jgi:hypothetical protein
VRKEKQQRIHEKGNVQASLGTSSGMGNSASLEGKEPLSRGLFYQPPVSSLASGRSLSIAVTQVATWKTANEMLGGEKGGAAIKEESSGLSLSLPLAKSLTNFTQSLARTSGHSAQNSDKSGGISKSLLTSMSNAQKAQAKNRGRFGLMGCVGCSSCSVAHAGPSSMGP